MTIEPSGEKPREVSARESGLATITLKSGAEFGFRPTILDSKPWNQVVVTIFRMDPTVEKIDEIELKTGAPALSSKGKPSFRVAITKVADPPDPISAGQK